MFTLDVNKWSWYDRLAEVQWRDDVLIEFVSFCQPRVTFSFQSVYLINKFCLCVCVVHCDWAAVNRWGPHSRGSGWEWWTSRPIRLCSWVSVWGNSVCNLIKAACSFLLTLTLSLTLHPLLIEGFDKFVFYSCSRIMTSRTGGLYLSSDRGREQLKCFIFTVIVLRTEITVCSGNIPLPYYHMYKDEGIFSNDKSEHRSKVSIKIKKQASTVLEVFIKEMFNMFIWTLSTLSDTWKSFGFTRTWKATSY